MDRFNYMKPTANYDKWLRRLRPEKSSLKVEMVAPESPQMNDSDDCGSGALLSVPAAEALSRSIRVLDAV